MAKIDHEFSVFLQSPQNEEHKRRIAVEQNLNPLLYLLHLSPVNLSKFPKNASKITKISIKLTKILFLLLFLSVFLISVLTLYKVEMTKNTSSNTHVHQFMRMTCLTLMIVTTSQMLSISSAIRWFSTRALDDLCERISEVRWFSV
jgi:hypothetical protein